MNYETAVSLLERHTLPDLVANIDAGFNANVTFVSPVVSTVLAASAIFNSKIGRVQFGSDSQHYAEVIGLTEALMGRDPVGSPGGQHGQTYSRLAKLYNHAQVDACNRVIADLLHSQLDGRTNQQFVHDVIKVVGEMHDNVPSHANGVGFSAAQVYNNGRLQYAIADCGCGMLEKVRKLGSSINSHVDAIEWCLQRGNTTAKKRDDWAQRVPDDAIISPYPDGVEAFSNDNHHKGEGLWKLTELVRRAGGSAWIWSGDGTLLIDANGVRRKSGTRCDWPGLVIELEFDVMRARELFDSQSFEVSSPSIAERFGL